MQQKDRLVIVLQQITKRYCSIFFSKLVLLQQQQEVEDQYIRHYDIECEAVQTMADTLNTKIKAIQFRSFYLIKLYKKDNLFKRKNKSNLNTDINNVTSRSFYEKNFFGKSFQQLKRVPQTTRANQTFNSRNLNKSDLFQQIDQSMSALMSKMKYLNCRFSQKDSQLDPEQREFSEKLQKRKLIIAKLNQLENGLEELISEEGGEKNIQNIVTSSQVTLRYHPLFGKSNKTSRLINRTFF